MTARQGSRRLALRNPDRSSAVGIDPQFLPHHEKLSTYSTQGVVTLFEPAYDGRMESTSMRSTDHPGEGPSRQGLTVPSGDVLEDVLGASAISRPPRQPVHWSPRSSPRR